MSPAQIHFLPLKEFQTLLLVGKAFFLTVFISSEVCDRYKSREPLHPWFSSTHCKSGLSLTKPDWVLLVFLMTGTSYFWLVFKEVNLFQAQILSYISFSWKKSMALTTYKFSITPMLYIKLEVEMLGTQIPASPSYTSGRGWRWNIGMEMSDWSVPVSKRFYLCNVQQQNYLRSCRGHHIQCTPHVCFFTVIILVLTCQQEPATWELFE